MRSKVLLTTLSYSTSIFIFGLHAPAAQKEVYTFLLVFCFGTVLCMGLFFGLQMSFAGSNVIAKNKYPFLLLIFAVITFLPLLTESYLFYDDYWAFASSDNGATAGLHYARLFQGMLSDYFSFAFPSRMYIIRIFMAGMSILFSLVLFSWIEKHSKNRRFAFLITCLVSLSSPIVDCIAYPALMTYSFGLVAAAVSVLTFERAFYLWSKYKQQAIVMFGATFVLLFTAFQCYQIVLPVLFLMFAVYAYYAKERKELVKIFFSYMTFFAIAVAFSFLSVYLLDTSGNISPRGRTISSYYEFTEKIKWFFLFILPAAMNRILAAVGGRLLFASKNYWYTLSFVDMPAFLILLIKGCGWSLVAAGLVSCGVKQKKLLETLFLALCIPGSYFVFLVLAENTYHTHYAYVLISLLIVYMALGLKWFLELVSLKRKKITAVFICLAVLGMFQANVYIRQFWVAENQSSYGYIKNTLAASYERNPSTWIHVYGTPNPGQAEIYSVFAVRTALGELGHKADEFKITVSHNEYFLVIMENHVFHEVLSRLTPEEQYRMHSYYDYGEAFNNYRLNTLDPGIMPDLQYLLRKAGFLPEPNDTSVLVIDLRWISPVWNVRS